MNSRPETDPRPVQHLVLPTDVARPEQWQTEHTSVAAFRRGPLEVLVAEPHGGAVRLDPSTGEPIKPLFIALGINGDQKLLWTTIALAQEDQRQVVGIRYPEKLVGAATPKARPELTVGADIIPKVTDLDMNQASDILHVLDELQAPQVDALAESRGTIALTVAMKQAPERFGDSFFVHPMGPGKESYGRAHGGAALIALQNIGRKVVAREDIDPLARQLAGQDHQAPSRLSRDPLGWRREQVSAAVARKAHINHLQAAIKAGLRPDQSIHIGYDPKDPAIRKRRLSKHNVGGVPMVETHFGRHGIGYSRQVVRGIAEYFQHLERLRASQR